MGNAPNDDIDRLLRRTVEDGRLPRVAVLVADESGVIYQRGAGTLDTTDGRVPGGAGTLQIKSTTKVVTCVAAWQLVERGELALEDQVETSSPSSPVSVRRDRTSRCCS